jgi:Peptidase family M23
MRLLYRYLLPAFLVLPFGLLAQKKDTLRLTCLLNDAIEAPAERQGVDFGKKELKIVLSSATDTLVKACADAVIGTVQKDADDGTWEIVFSHKNYWFWLSGLSKVVVRKDQKVKAGDTLGYLDNGKKIELLLYDFETPIDPKKYMNCGK